MYSKGIFSLPSIATLAAAVVVIRCFLFRKREIRADPPVADDNHTEPSKLASALSSSSDSAATIGAYEVFLSFCGRDMRKGFTDFLYTYLVGAGIRTFRDDNELRVGNEIGPELLKSIQESKISVPIFSENYAASKWCLLELEQMVHWHKNGGQMIYPVFYDVDPSDVRNQTGSYKKGFRQHEKSFGKDNVQRWRNALNMVGKMKGLELKKETDGRQGELVKIVVEEILSKLQKNYTHVPEKLVGCDNHIEKMMGLLEVDSKDVRIVGIHGMGGLGKTTIAQVIYNQLFERFEGYCFLDNVRENCKRQNGTIDLQKHLIKNILKCRHEESFYDSDQGRRRIKDVVSGKKLLIVLDDVDDISQVDKLMGHHSWFCPQTRIILTTRDKHVLDEIEVNCQSEDPPAAGYRSYNPDFLDKHDSLQLFSKYAFKKDLPVEGYGMLAEEVVTIAAGLPLVLVVLGSTFFLVKDKDIWEEKLRQLQEIPNNEVMEKLKFSFEALEHHEKQIFLDIACFFIGRDKTMASYMWEDCRFYPILGIRSLISRSLINIGDDNTFIMHDQLRDLGRQIVYEESLYKLEKQTRLWRTEEAMQILSRCQGTSSVDAIFLRDSQYSVAASQFRDLLNLRFLSMWVKEVDGNFKDLLPNLRWLKWNCRGKFSPINLNMKNLVVLDLSETSNVAEDWEGWKQLKMANKLKCLDLSYCRNIRVLPDLSLANKLKCLDLSYCKNIRVLPDLSFFASLEILKLMYCSSLCGLDGLQLLKSLRQLKARGCTGLETLPYLSNLTKLIELDLYECEKLIKIHGLQKLESLQVLCITFCSSLETLPNISNLKSLKELDACMCANLIQIVGLHGLNSLEHLDLSNCEILKGVGDLSNLNKLQVLRAPGLEITDFSIFKMLKELEIFCSNLMEFQGLDRLEVLEFLRIHECRFFKRLPNLAYLKRLKRIRITDCDKLIDVQGIDRLESLEKLNITSCSSIERSSLSNLWKLEELEFYYCNKLIEVQGIDRLESLKFLKIVHCLALERLPNLANSRMLKDLKVSFCIKLQELEGVGVLESLECLHIVACDELQEIPDLRGLKKLKRLSVCYLSEPIGIYGLEELISLKSLDLSNCSSIEALPDLLNLQKLTKLDVSGCVKLTEIHGLEALESLESLNLSECSSIEALPDLSNLQKLTEVDVSGCVKLTEIHGFEELMSLESLNLSECNSIEALPDLSKLHKLTKLDVFGCVKLTEIRGLEELESLWSLNLSRCSSIEALPNLSNLQKLTKLDVSGFVKLTEIHGLEEVESLESLNVSECSSIESLPDLSNLQMLTDLDVSGCVKLTEIHGLEELESLESLNLSECISIEALPDLSNLQKLTELDVSGCAKLTEIPGLEELVSLESLYVSGCVKLTVIRGLETLKSLNSYMDYKGNWVNPQI